MYASIRIYAEAAGLADVAAEHEDEILGLFREIDGFHHYHAVKTGPTSVTTVTICDDQAGADASIQVARDWIAANCGHLSISAPEVHVGEVAMGT